MNQDNTVFLIEQLNHNPSVAKRREAATRLAKTQQEEPIPHLINALADHEDVAVFATFSLVKIGKSAIPNLLAGLRSKNEQTRGYCAEILGELHATKAENLLIDLIKNDPCSWVINNAIEALGQLKTGKHIEVLRDLIHHPDTQIAVNAALAIRKITADPEIGLFLLDRLLENKNAEHGMIVWSIIEICTRNELPEIIHRRDELKDSVSQKILSEIIQGISLK